LSLAGGNTNDNIRANRAWRASARYFSGAKIVSVLTVSSIVTILCCALSSMPATASRKFESRGTARSPSSARSPSDSEVAGMDSVEFTQYVFVHRGCDGCHTLSADWKLGFTDRGKELAKGFEGCAPLLDAMFVVVQVPPASRTGEGKQKAARFQEFGCTTCHEIDRGKTALTKSGLKMKSLHLNCIAPLCCGVKKRS
jgi:cytochrome c551/c552